jgi:hypothetical protein
MTNPTTPALLALAERVERAAPEQQAELILAAWLERNPEPQEEGYDRGFWGYREARLRKQLDCGAYESAVIQHLLPEGWAWNLYSDGPTYAASAEIGPHPEGGAIFRAATSSDGATPALALCAASLRARASEAGA